MTWQYAIIPLLEMGADVMPVVFEGKLAKLGPQCDMMLKNWALTPGSSSAWTTSFLGVLGADV